MQLAASVMPLKGHRTTKLTLHRTSGEIDQSALRAAPRQGRCETLDGRTGERPFKALHLWTDVQTQHLGGDLIFLLRLELPFHWVIDSLQESWWPVKISAATCDAGRDPGSIIVHSKLDPGLHPRQTSKMSLE